MYCPECGKEISDNTSFCPNCGMPMQEKTPSKSNLNMNAGQKAPYNTMCIVGLVVSCISLLLNYWGLMGIAGTILSVIGLANCKKNSESGNILAIIGIVIGVVSIAYGVLAILALSQF